MPKIFHTDQGVQFTSAVFTGCLRQYEIRISIDSEGCYRDNIGVERPWRTVKYECLYIQAFDSGKALQQGLTQYFDWYNRQRSHQGLDDQTPDEVYRGCPIGDKPPEPNYNNGQSLSNPSRLPKQWGPIHAVVVL